ncbi:MAG: hypothetical protein LBH00_01640 [Planctomycetaceae bacterium]|nr:hypothetical protein [Planctomycetaceae bacterium]
MFSNVRTQHFTPNTPYNTCKPGVKAAIRKQSVNGSGVRAISRCPGVDKNRVIAELKKKPTYKQRQQRRFQDAVRR